MGTHHSKDTIEEDHSVLIDKNNNRTSNSYRKKTSSPSTTVYHGWQEICRCSHADWLQTNAERFAFHPHKFPCTSELHNICAPGFCSESLSRKLHYHSLNRSTSSSSTTKSRKLREHFEYNHIPAMISSLQNYSVHAIVNGCSLTAADHEDTIMLLIYSVVLDKTKFIIVDLKINRFVCALGDDYHGLVDVRKVHSAWSRDKTQVIIRLPTLSGSATLDFYQIMKKEAKLYRRIVSIDLQCQFQFCPNYWSSHLAFYTDSTKATMTLTNYNISSLTSSGSNRIATETLSISSSSVGPTLSLINVHRWSILRTQSIQFEMNDFRLLSFVYTPDSVYLILTFVDRRCHCDSTVAMCYFDLYHSNTFQHLYRFNPQLISRLCPTHMCRNSFTPIFSYSAARMAFSTSRTHSNRDLQVSIVNIPNELNLKSICRRVILDYLHEYRGSITDLTSELPYRLSQFLQYRPEYQ